MSEFQLYRRTAVAELRDLTDKDTKGNLVRNGVSISSEDLITDWETFKKGKIGRNPKNHKDQWYINGQYVEDNFEEVPKTIIGNMPEGNPGNDVESNETETTEEGENDG